MIELPPAQDGPRRDERGQTLVIFALAFIGIVAMLGLVIDGGAAYAYRRDAQNAADMGALAGANDFLSHHSVSQATAAAQAVAAANGFTDGSGGISVDVTVTPGNGTTVKVDVTAPHQNYFSAIVGQPSWDVGATATALTGIPNAAKGASPFIASIDAFNSDGSPKYTTPTNFGETNGDVPTSSTDIAWTNYGTGNVNSSEVADIIDGSTTINSTLTYGEYIGQQNNGNHTALYSDVDTYLSGKDMPVAVVDASGNFMGWATFHVNSASGGSNKHINGYFLSSFVGAQTTISSCSNNACPRYLGTYVLKLTN